MKPNVTGDGDVVARAEEVRVGVDEFSGKVALADQILRAIAIVEDGVEEGGALGDGLIEKLPLVFGEDEGKRIEGPEALGPAGIAVDVVGDSVVADDLLGGVPAALELGLAEGG